MLASQLLVAPSCEWVGAILPPPLCMSWGDLNLYYSVFIGT